MSNTTSYVKKYLEKRFGFQGNLSSYQTKYLLKCRSDQELIAALSEVQ